MLSLDDDCLYLIFDLYLNLKDQLAMTKVCKRFNDLIINYIWKKRYRQVCTHRFHPNIQNCMMPHEVSIANIQIDALNKQDYEDFFTLNAANIKELHIHDSKITAFSTYLGRNAQRPENLFYILLNYLRLTVLKFDYSRLHDGDIKLLTRNCPMLEELYVCSEYLTGKWINMFPKLRRFKARNCNLQLVHLDEIITELDNLVSLDVCNNAALETDIIRTWGTNLQELQLDGIQFNKQIYPYSMHERCGGIKNLSVFFIQVYPVKLDILSRYLKNEGIYVKKLKIRQHIVNMSNSESHDFSTILPNIEEIRIDVIISGYITDYAYDSVEHAIRIILKQLQFDPNRFNLNALKPPKILDDYKDIRIETDKTSKVKLLVRVTDKDDYEDCIDFFQMEFF